MKIFNITIFITLLILVSCNSKNKEKQELESVELNIQSTLTSNVFKTKEVLKTLKYTDSFPRHIVKNKTNWEFVKVSDWCSGFWPGILWYSYEFSGDESIKNAAIDYTSHIKTIAYTPATDHDIGFQVYSSYGNGFRLTGNEKYKNIMLVAADTLATLYNSNVGSIHSWPMKPEYPHNTIIDNMMNLELLFWASKNGGEKSLFDIAQSHAEVTMKNIVKPDSTVYHLGSFNNKTGNFIKGYTHQGYADESMWARGQTWGIYGFAIASRETGRKDFLNTAIKLANHYISRLPEDNIPFWDFDDPMIPNAPKDASAAAIAACGMLELSNLLENGDLKEKYINEATNYIAMLSSDKYYSGSENQAFLLHSTGHHPKGREIDESIIYADYYFMEALLRLKELDEESKIVSK